MIGTQKGTIILTIPHIASMQEATETCSQREAHVSDRFYYRVGAKSRQR